MSSPSLRSLVLLILGVMCAAQAGAQPRDPIPGRNVNMVAGTNLPNGDPFLQRQNEPSVAVSSRNPLHLLAGANDYRTVDFPGDPLDGDLPEEIVKGDAWLGWFKSFDGGESWITGLLPGFPQDLTEAGTLSPISGFSAGSDPVVRAGSNGMFYYSGIVFDREGTDKGDGAVFVARYIDNANKEGTKYDPAINPDPIKYIDTVLIDTGNAGQFIDKPWLAVDIPRPGGATCTIPALQDTVPEFVNGVRTGQGTPITIPPQTFAAGNAYLAYAIFVGNDNNIRTKIMFTRSTDCGFTWDHPIQLSEGYPINQGTIVAIDPISGHLYVGWRRFASPSKIDAMMIAKSTDAGKTFTRAIEVASFAPSQLFEQGTTEVSPRTNAFPTMTVDAEGRVYMAWAQRGLGPGGTIWSGDARIVVKTSPDGLVWPAPAHAIDNQSGRLLDRGHQFMPSLSFAAGKVFLLYYDVRQDHTAGVFVPNSSGQFEESRQALGDLQTAGGEDLVFTDFLVEGVLEPDGSISGPLQSRHTINVRAAQSDPAAIPVFTESDRPSVRVSRYVHAFVSSSNEIRQLKFNPPGYTLFDGGTKPFIGDYIDSAASPGILPDPDNPTGWIFNTGPAGSAAASSAPTLSPVFHTTWTDNRDVRPPVDNNWTTYNPPDTIQPGFGTGTVCTDGNRTGLRDQNVYTARLTEGLFVGALGNSKRLIDSAGIPVQRAFAVFARNATRELLKVRLSVLPQPDVVASFDQFDPFVPSLDVDIFPLSSVTRSLFVTRTDTSTAPIATVRVEVRELDAGTGVPLLDGLQGQIVLNPDILSPDILTPDILSPDILSPDILSLDVEVYNPDILSIDVSNPDILSPDILSPDILSPDILTPDILSPDILSPDILSPDILSPDILSPDILSPDILSANLTTAELTNITWRVRNLGNTTAAYTFAPLIATAPPNSIKFQLLVYRVSTTPTSLGCELKETAHVELVANIVNPDILTPDILSPDILSPDILSTATFSVPPGEDEATFVTLRVLDPDKTDGDVFDPDEVSGVVAPEAVNTEDAENGISVPPIVISDLEVSNLVFVSQPTDTAGGVPISPAVAILAETSTGFPVPGTVITIDFGTNPCPGFFSETTAVLTDITGVATFTDLGIVGGGVGYTLVASAFGGVTEVSVPFDIVGPCQVFSLGPDGISGTGDDGTTVDKMDADRNGDGAITVEDTFLQAIAPGVFRGTCSNAPRTTCQTIADCPGAGAGDVCYNGVYIRGSATGVGLNEVAGLSCGGFADPLSVPACDLDPDFPMDWHLHCPPGATNCPNLASGTCVGGCSYDTPANGAHAVSPPNSLHLGAHFDLSDSALGDTTHLRAVQGFQSAPLNLALFPGAPGGPGNLELSFQQIARLMDNNGVGGNTNHQCADCADVQIQVDTNPDQDIDDWGFWEKLVPFQSVYDKKVMAWSVFSSYYCVFTPKDTGAAPPNPRGVHETLCYPQGAWSRCGSTTATTLAATGNCAGPSTLDANGAGIWLETKFDLSAFVGQRVRIRWIAESWLFDATSGSYFEVGLGWNSTTADDGWWIDDITVSGTVREPL